MSWDTSLADLRSLISDGPEDKYNFRKKVFGQVDGANVNFKTLEVRRITDFTTSAAPFGIYVNNALVTVTTDFVDSGEFTLAVAPNSGDVIEASYYSQWFLDSELTTFLTMSARWCLAVDDVTTVPSGLIPAALHYGAAEAYQKLSLRFSRMKSDEYRVEDAQDKRQIDMALSYQKSATSERQTAETLRSQFYTRNDQYKSPLYNTASGFVPSVQPKR